MDDDDHDACSLSVRCVRREVAQRAELSKAARMRVVHDVAWVLAGVVALALVATGIGAVVARIIYRRREARKRFLQGPYR